MLVFRFLDLSLFYSVGEEMLSLEFEEKGFEDKSDIFREYGWFEVLKGDFLRGYRRIERFFIVFDEFRSVFEVFRSENRLVGLVEYS